MAVVEQEAQCSVHSISFGLSRVHVSGLSLTGLVQLVGRLSCVDGAGGSTPPWPVVFSVGLIPTGWHALCTMNKLSEEAYGPW